MTVSAPARLAGVPTWREIGADVVVDNLRGIVAPRDLPAPQVAYGEVAVSRGEIAVAD
jgi:tripartite-type tricarboxylate transporter receptor subunit TctC